MTISSTHVLYISSWWRTIFILFLSGAESFTCQHHVNHDKKISRFYEGRVGLFNVWSVCASARVRIWNGISGKRVPNRFVFLTDFTAAFTYEQIGTRIRVSKSRMERSETCWKKVGVPVYSCITRPAYVYCQLIDWWLVGLFWSGRRSFLKQYVFMPNWSYFFDGHISNSWLPYMKRMKRLLRDVDTLYFESCLSFSFVQRTTIPPFGTIVTYGNEFSFCLTTLRASLRT